MPKHCWILAVSVGLLVNPAPALWGASGTFIHAGVPYTIKPWETDDGLPQGSILSLTQTRDGYLWLGTLNGLVRFDGIRFTVFDESNTPGLNSSRIVSLFEDSRSNLWVGTETAGTTLFKDGQATRQPIGQGGKERRLVSACEDAQGVVWLYAANGELWRYENGHLQPSFLVDRGRDSNCRAIIAETNGPVWVGVDSGLFSLSRTANPGSLELPVDERLPVNKLDFLLASQRGGYWRLADGRVQKWRANRLDRDWGAYPWTNAHVSSACEDLEGNLLVGTKGAGLFWFDSDGQATCISTNQGLSHDYVLSLQVDREGTLWVGTDNGGLNRIKRQVFDTLEASQGWVVQSVCEDDQGGLWIGCNGSGANYWKGGNLKRFDAGQGLFNPSVRAMFVDRQQRVWAGTLGGLFQLQNDRFQPDPKFEGISRPVYALYQDRQGNVWAGTQGGLARWDERAWKVFTTRDGLSADAIRAITEDREGNLWVGTSGGGLNRLRDGQFTPFRKQAGGLPSDDISSLYADGDGVLWIGTLRSGLARFYGGNWTCYTTHEGLIGNSIRYVIADDQGCFWIGSNAGLMRVARQTLNDFANGLTKVIAGRAYEKPDGLPTRECTPDSQPGACRTREGKLWFPTTKGLASVNPARLNFNTNPPPVIIEMVLVEGQTQNTNRLLAGRLQAVTIPPGKEQLEIHYTSLNLTAPERARFKYRLEDSETNKTTWTEAGDTRIANYNKLSPGHYRFHVTACNEDGVWNPVGSVLAITVEPPFWQTGWFLGITAAGLLGSIIAVVHYLSTQKLQRQLERLKQQEALEKERSRIARDIHDQLGANLTQVSLLGELVESDKAFPEEVVGHARQITQTARDTSHALDEIVWAVNPTNDSLDGLVTYVCKYAQEYLAVAGLRYRLDVPVQLPVVAIPPEVRHNVFLASKEAITNVVRHAKATSVWIRLKLEPTRFILEIEDNGRGLAGLDAKAAQTRNGLRNMRKRMEDIGGSFSLLPATEKGAVIRLVAPLQDR